MKLVSSGPRRLQKKRMHLRKVELQRIVGTQADVEARPEEVGQRVPLVREEERIVRKRRHGDL